jgi:hypothetical protein
MVVTSNGDQATGRRTQVIGISVVVLVVFRIIAYSLWESPPHSRRTSEGNNRRFEGTSLRVTRFVDEIVSHCCNYVVLHSKHSNDHFHSTTLEKMMRRGEK